MNGRRAVSAGAARIAAFVALLLGHQASGQVVLLEFEGDSSSNSYFGVAVDNAGDLDGDGVQDLLVGEPNYVQGGRFGRALVYSGATRALIRTHQPSPGGSSFGQSLASVGDLDGDGVAEYVVGAPFTSNYKGRIDAFSGATGAKLWDAEGAVPLDELGTAIAKAGDLDGDGRPEILASRPGGQAVDVYDASGSLLYTVTGQKDAHFGDALVGLGDIDGDGKDEFAVGEPYYDDNSVTPPVVDVGRVRVYSGATGSILKASFGDFADDFYGSSLARVADLDGDGHDDLLVGAPFGNAGPGYASGYVRALSVKSNSELWTNAGARGYTLFGSAVEGLGDLDLDGVPDYAVSSPGVNLNLGQIDLFSGADGTLLTRFVSDDVTGSFGISLAAGDWNGDGVADWLIGDPFYVPDPGESGRMLVVAGCPARAENYGTGWPGTLGVPSLDCLVKPAIGDLGEIRIGNSQSGLAFGVLYVGFDDLDLPTSADGSLLVLPSFLVPFYVYGKDTRLWAPIPDDPALAFLELYLQAIEADPGASKGLSFTPGLKLTIGFAIPE